jgi:cytochrome P450
MYNARIELCIINSTKTSRPEGESVRASKERTSDWSPVGEAAVLDPMAEQARLREECPVAWSDSLGEGFWAITRYADVAKAAANPTVFSNTGNPRFGDRPSPPIEVDRPRHTIYRRLLQPYFRPERVQELEIEATRIAYDLLRPLVAARQVDLAPLFTYPFPSRVLCALLKLPFEDAEHIKQWADEVYLYMEERENRPDLMRAAEQRIDEYAHAIVAKRRTMDLDPATDLLTGLIETEVEGRRMTDEEIMGMIRLLLSAGHNSTTSSLGIVFLRLAERIDLQRELRNDRTLIPGAIEEFLRHESPVMTTKRLALEDIEFGGRQIRAGDQVFLLWSSANRDEEHYGDADQIDIRRENRDHMVFGRGAHRCLGSPIALMELRVAVEAVFDLTTSFELAGDVQRANWERFGVTSLPIAFTPSN